MSSHLIIQIFGKKMIQGVPENVLIKSFNSDLFITLTQSFLISLNSVDL